MPEGTDVDADRAVRAARGAFEAWARSAAEERARALERLQQGLAARADEIASTITAEVGMPLALSRTIQAGSPVAVMGSYAALVRAHAFEETVGHSVVVQEPAGVVAAITPWNYPLHQAVAKVAPALAAGCTVVLKPSEVAPLSAFILAEVADAAGLPPGVFNLVTGYGTVVGEALARHPDVDMVSFTGSTARREAGRRGRRADGEAGGAGAGRQVRVGPARRRRLPQGRARHAELLLPELGPDLQRAHADARASRPRRRGGAAGGGGGGPVHRRRPLRGGDQARAARLGGAARPRAGLRPEGPRGRRPAGHGRRRSRPTASARATT